MTDDGRVEYDVADGVATVTLENAERRNSLTPVMVDDLHDICDRLHHAPDVGAVVIRGAGGAFCSGLDREVIAVQSADPVSDAGVERAAHVYASFSRFGTVPMPVIAAVRGAAVGAGLNLALVTDVRVVADDARLLAGFTRLGLHPGGGFFSLAGRGAGREAAAALGVFGEELTGRRLYELGGAWRSVPDDSVEDVAFALAARCAADPDLARATVRSFRQSLGPPALPHAVAVDLERAPQAWTFRRAGQHSEGAGS